MLPKRTITTTSNRQAAKIQTGDKNVAEGDNYNYKQQTGCKDINRRQKCCRKGQLSSTYPRIASDLPLTCPLHAPYLPLTCPLHVCRSKQNAIFFILL